VRRGHRRTARCVEGERAVAARSADVPPSAGGAAAVGLRTRAVVVEQLSPRCVERVTLPTIPARPASASRDPHPQLGVETRPPSPRAGTLAAMPNVARVTAVAGAMLIGLALTGCTVPIDPVLPDAAGPATSAAPTTSAPTPTAEAPAESTPCQDRFSAELLGNPDSGVPVTAT